MPAGSYNLVLSAVGYETQKKNVTLTGTEVLSVDFLVVETTTQLQEVEITGRKATSYISDVSFVGTKTGTALKDVPQSIAVITKEVMQDQQIYQVNDVVKNVSGVNQFSHYNDITMRGFRSDANFINGLRAGFSFWTVPVTPHYERIEILKGPSSVLFGNATPGGIINMVTKKPLDEARQSLSFTIGSFDTYRTTVDVTGPINKEKTVLYNLNVGYENAKTFRDFINNESLVVAPSVSFLPTPKTRINMEMVYGGVNTKLDKGMPVIGKDFNIPDWVPV